MVSRLVASIVSLLAGAWAALAPYLGPHVGLAMAHMGVQITRSTVFYHFVPGGAVVTLSLYLIATDPLVQHLLQHETPRSFAGRAAARQ
ncbi:MAG: hypothetical protein ACR2PL_04130 [Dehalococcoidia bacterium]